MADKKTTKKQIETKPKRTVSAKNAAVASAEHVRGHVGGFVDFIRSQGVIGLAIGLAIGAAAGAAVKAIVEGFINPIVQFIIGTQQSLSEATWTFEAFGRSATFAWGAAVSAFITLLATALVIYWFVNIFKLDKLDKKKD
ncbi:MAG: MscL family protein [Candidatus Microsaccharimonas sp.]